jgi:nucleolar protein 12
VSSVRRSSNPEEVGDPENDLSALSDEEDQEKCEAKLKKKKKVKPAVDLEEEKERLERTVFVGGIPTSVIKGEKLAKYFQKFGKVESVRFRSIAMAKMSNAQMRRVGYIKGEFNEKQETCNGYVVFEDKNSVPLALAENGRDDFVSGYPLRVDKVEPTISHKKSVFVGNLPFTVQERELRAAFEDCGAIEYVRVVRDKATSLGRGYAYVCFVKREGAKLAAEKSKVEVGGRAVRIERCKERF